MRKFKVATSASYYTHPEVLKVLMEQDLILTTNASAVPVLAELLPSKRIICAENSGGWPDDRVLQAARMFLPCAEEVTMEDLEITHFGTLRRLTGDDNCAYKLPDELDAPLRAMYGMVNKAAHAIIQAFMTWDDKRDHTERVERLGGDNEAVR